MGGGVGFHGGTDVVALAVGDDVHPLFLRIGDGLRQGLHPVPAVQLIISRLGLHRRDNVADGVDQRSVILQHCLRRPLQRIGKLPGILLPDKLRHIGIGGIQPHHGGVFGSPDPCDQRFKRHENSSLKTTVNNPSAAEGADDLPGQLHPLEDGIFRFGVELFRLHHPGFLQIRQRQIRRIPHPDVPAGDP